MAGGKINRVKETLQLFLRSLPEGTLFNVIGFGTDFKKLFEGGSVEYNDKNLTTATEHVNGMTANMGGTDILKPLMAIFGEKAKPGIPRQIFLLTDGEVNNTQECIAAVRKNANSTRVFTFGIGGEASTELVRGMAKAGEGQCEMIRETTTMKEQVMKMLSKALQPALTDITINWGGCKVQQTPFILPPLFNGSRMIIYGFVMPGAQAGDVTLSGKFGESVFTATARLDPGVVAQGTQVAKLAARSLIRDLEEGRSHMSPCTEAVAKQEMIRVSTLYQILSKHTAFVAIEERAEATEGTMQQRAVKIAPAAPTPAKPVAAPSGAGFSMGGLMTAGFGGGSLNSTKTGAKLKRASPPPSQQSYVSADTPALMGALQCRRSAVASVAEDEDISSSWE